MHKITDQTRIRFDDRCKNEDHRSLNHGHVITLREFFDVNNEADPDFEDYCSADVYYRLSRDGEWRSEEGGMGSQVYLVVQE